MRTFEALHADALASAVTAIQAGNRDEAQTYAARAEMWNDLDRDALARAARRGDGKGAHHG